MIQNFKLQLLEFVEYSGHYKITRRYADVTEIPINLLNDYCIPRELGIDWINNKPMINICEIKELV